MQLITQEAVASRLPLRPPFAHKEHFGRVLVVAGSRRMCGAGFLCALGALRAGAGLVAWALPKSLQPSFAAALPEAITVPLEETPDGFLSAQAQTELEQFCQTFKPSVLAAGPGMGSSPLLAFLLQQNQLPAVLDADALNFLAANRSVKLAPGRPVIFTPHSGEMARLLQSPVAQTDEQRRFQACLWAQQTGGVTVLKGAGTWVVCGEEVWKNTTGSSALAKAGSGDLLTGITVGLWAQLGSAQGFNLQNALDGALCAVYLHGLAGVLAAQTITQYGVLARDTAQYVAEAFKQLEEVGRHG